MIQAFVALIFILFLYSFYIFWFKPTKINQYYANQLRKRGYKVLQVPFNPFKNDMIMTMKKGREQGDALKLYKEERAEYDVIISNTLNRPRLQFHHPDFIKDYFSIDKHYDFNKAQNVVNVLEMISGRGLVFSQGESWKKKRNILNKIFNFDFVKSQTKNIARLCDQAFLSVQSEYSKSKSQNSIRFPIIEWTVRVFSGVMMQIFMGGSSKQKIEDQLAGNYLRKLINDISSNSFTPIKYILGPKISKLGLTKIDKDIQRRVRTARQWGFWFIKKRNDEIKQKFQDQTVKKEPSDLMEALYLAKQKSKLQKDHSQQFLMSDQQIFDEFMSFFIAGTDSSSNYLQMMIYETARNPQIDNKVRSQIQLNMSQENYTYDNLKKFPYIQLIQKEVTRTYGPANQLFSRIAMKDTYINGLLVQKGTGVSIFFVGNHFSQKYFKNPFQFRPQRWQSQCNDIPSYALGGFSAGSRTCIGKHLALLQSKIAFIKFLKHYKQIILPKTNFKMCQKFLYCPQDFQSTMVFKNKQM